MSINRRTSTVPLPGYTSAAVGSSVIKMTSVSYGISRKIGDMKSKLPVRTTQPPSYGSPRLQLQDANFRTTARQISNQPFTSRHQLQQQQQQQQARNRGGGIGGTGGVRDPTKFAKKTNQIVHMPLIRAVAGAGSIVVVPQAVAATLLERARQQQQDELLTNENTPSILLNDQPLSALRPLNLFNRSACAFRTIVAHPLFRPILVQERKKFGKFKSLSRAICRASRMVDGVRGGRGRGLATIEEAREVGSNEAEIKAGSYPLLKREILEQLFEFLTVNELKCARLVCEFWGRFASVCLQRKSVVRLSGNCDICKSEYMSTDEAVESHEHIETISFYRFVLFILEIPQEKRYALPYRHFKIRKLNLYFISGLNTEPTRVFLMFLKLWADKIHHLHLQNVHMCPPDSFYRVLDSCSRLQSVIFDGSNFWLDPLAPAAANQPFIMKVNYYLTSLTFCTDWICEELLHWQMIFNAFPKLQELNLCDMSKSEINHCLSILLNLPDAEEEEELRKTSGFKTLSKVLMFQPFVPNKFAQTGEAVEPPQPVAFKKVTRLHMHMPFAESRQEKLDQLRAANGERARFKNTALSLLNQPFGFFSKKEKQAAQQMMEKSRSFRGLAKTMAYGAFTLPSRLQQQQKQQQAKQDSPKKVSNKQMNLMGASIKGFGGKIKKPPLKAKALIAELQAQRDKQEAEQATSAAAAAAAAESDAIGGTGGESTGPKQPSSTPASPALSLKSVKGGVIEPEKSAGTGGDAPGTPEKGRKSTVKPATAETPPPPPAVTAGQEKLMKAGLKGLAGKVGDQPFRARGMVAPSPETESPTPTPTPPPAAAAAAPAAAAAAPVSTTDSAVQQNKALKSLFGGGKKGLAGSLVSAAKSGAIPPRPTATTTTTTTTPGQPPVVKKEEGGTKGKARTILNQPFTLVSPEPESAQETFQAIIPFKKNALSLTKQPFKLTGMEKNLIDRFKSTAKNLKNQPFNLGEAKPKEKVLPGSRLAKVNVSLRGKLEDHLKLDLPPVTGETDESEEEDAENNENGDDDDDDEDEEKDEEEDDESDEEESTPIGEADFDDLDLNDLLTEAVARFPITHLTLRVHYTKEDAEKFPIVLEACRDKLKFLTLTRHPKFFFPEMELQFRSNPFEMAETETMMQFPLVTSLSIAHNVVDDLNEITIAFPALTTLIVNVVPTEFIQRHNKAAQPYKTYVRTNLMFSLKTARPNSTVKNLTWNIVEARNPQTQKRTTVYKSNAIRHLPLIFPTLSKLCVSITTAVELHTIFKFCTQLHDFVVLKNSFYRTKDEDIVGVEEEDREKNVEEEQEKQQQKLQDSKGAGGSFPSFTNYGIKQLKFLRRLSLQNNNCNLSNVSIREGFIHLRRLRSLHISRGARIGVKALRLLKRCRFLVHVHVTKEKLKTLKPKREPTAEDRELEQLGLQRLPGYPGFYVTLAKPEEPSKPSSKFETSTKYDKLGGRKYDVIRTTYTVNGRTYVLVRKQYEYEGERDRQIWATRYRLAEFRKFHEAQQKAVEAALEAAAAEGLLDPERIIREAELRRQRELANEESDYERFLNDYDDDEEEDDEDGYGEQDEEDALMMEEEKKEEKKDLRRKAFKKGGKMTVTFESSDDGVDGFCPEADTMYEADREYFLDTVDEKNSTSEESYCDSVSTAEYQGDKETDKDEDNEKKPNSKNNSNEEISENNKENNDAHVNQNDDDSGGGGGDSGKPKNEDKNLKKKKQNEGGDKIKSKKDKDGGGGSHKKEKLKKDPLNGKDCEKIKNKKKNKLDPHHPTTTTMAHQFRQKFQDETDKIVADALIANETVGVEYAALKAYQARRFSLLTTTSSSSSGGGGGSSSSGLTAAMAMAAAGLPILPPPSLPMLPLPQLELGRKPLEKISKKDKHHRHHHHHHHHHHSKKEKSKKCEDNNNKGHHHHHGHRHRGEKKIEDESKGCEGSTTTTEEMVGVDEAVGELRQALIHKMVKNVRKELRK